MKSSGTDQDQAVTRLGAIGNAEWWHCRTCGEVWTTTLNVGSSAGPQLVAEARRHAATHARLQHSKSASWQRMPSTRAIYEKHR